MSEVHKTVWFGFASFLGFALACGGGGSAEGETCESDSECSEGLVCKVGSCVEPDNSDDAGSTTDTTRSTDEDTSEQTSNPDACERGGGPPSGDATGCFSTPSDASNVTLEMYTSVSEFESALEGCTQTITFEDVDTCRTTPNAIESDRYQTAYGLDLAGADGQFVGTGKQFTTSYVAISGLNTLVSGPKDDDPVTANKMIATFPATGNSSLVAGIGAHVIDADFPNYQQSKVAVFDKDGQKLKSKDITTGDGEAQFVGFVTVDGSGNPVAGIDRVKWTLGDGWALDRSNEGVIIDNVVLSTKEE